MNAWLLSVPGKEHLLPVRKIGKRNFTSNTYIKNGQFNNESEVTQLIIWSVTNYIAPWWTTSWKTTPPQKTFHSEFVGWLSPEECVSVNDISATTPTAFLPELQSKRALCVYASHDSRWSRTRKTKQEERKLVTISVSLPLLPWVCKLARSCACDCNSLQQD